MVSEPEDMVSEPEDMVSYGFLIIFSLIMLYSPWLLFSLSTWLFFVLNGLRGSS